MARTQRQTEYIAMIETGNESQLSAQLLLLSHDAAVVCCTEVLFQPSFSLSCSTCCPRNMRRTTRWLRYSVREQSTMRITRPYTAQSERALVRLVDTSSLQAVCIKPEESCTCHTCIDCVTSCVVLLVLHAHHDTRTSRMVAERCSIWIHGSLSSRSLMSCVQGWSVSMMSDINTCALGKTKSYTDKAAEWTTRQ